MVKVFSHKYVLIFHPERKWKEIYKIVNNLCYLIFEFPARGNIGWTCSKSLLFFNMDCQTYIQRRMYN